MNLYAALVAVKDYFGGLPGPVFKRRPWTDAICIDQQADNSDGDHQVGMMSEIYSRARRVLIWLGDDRQEALVAIPTLQARLQTATGLYGIPQLRDAIMPFFTAPYWSRA